MDTQGTSASSASWYVRMQRCVWMKCLVTKTTQSIGFDNYYAYSLYGVKMNMHFDLYLIFFFAILWLSIHMAK